MHHYLMTSLNSLQKHTAYIRRILRDENVFVCKLQYISYCCNFCTLSVYKTTKEIANSMPNLHVGGKAPTAKSFSLCKN